MFVFFQAETFSTVKKDIIVLSAYITTMDSTCIRLLKRFYTMMAKASDLAI